jgi:hypothetical protein
MPDIGLPEGIALVVFLLLGILGLVVSVLWIFMPFAVFGIKNRLDELIRINREIGRLLSLMDTPRGEALPPRPRPGENIEIPDSAREIFSTRRGD